MREVRAGSKWRWWAAAGVVVLVLFVASRLVCLGAWLRYGVVVRPCPDGDYRLRARVRSPLGEEKLDVPLAVYAPARIHVITDRPLYQPGSTVQFRAVVLRATDFGPVDDRPGKWIVQDPSGEVVLEEK